MPGSFESKGTLEINLNALPNVRRRCCKVEWERRHHRSPEALKASDARELHLVCGFQHCRIRSVPSSPWIIFWCNRLREYRPMFHAAYRADLGLVRQLTKRLRSDSLVLPLLLPQATLPLSNFDDELQLRNVMTGPICLDITKSILSTLQFW